MRNAKTITVLAKSREGKIVDIKMRLGLIPASYTGFVDAWSASTLNARLETVAELPSFQHAWAKKRRVIIPVESYAQKVTTGANVFGGKPAAKKVAITRTDGKPLGIAGIYDHAQTMDGPVLSVASLTREPGPRMEDAGLGVKRLDLHFIRVDNKIETMIVSMAKPVRDVTRLSKHLCDKIETVDPGLPFIVQM